MPGNYEPALQRQLAAQHGERGPSSRAGGVGIVVSDFSQCDSGVSDQEGTFFRTKSLGALNLSHVEGRRRAKQVSAYGYVRNTL